MQLTNTVVYDSPEQMKLANEARKEKQRAEAEQFSTSECFDGWRKPVKWEPLLADRMNGIGPCKGIIVAFSHHGARR